MDLYQTTFYLWACCDLNQQEKEHQGKASQSCIQHSEADFPHMFSQTDWVSSGTLGMASQAAQWLCSTDQYLESTWFKKNTHTVGHSRNKWRIAKLWEVGDKAEKITVDEVYKHPCLPVFKSQSNLMRICKAIINFKFNSKNYCL